MNLDLIPRPGVVREKLARNLRENRLLRALLRVAERAAEEWPEDRERAHTPPSQAAGRGVGHET
jgi:hypothetical protein